MPTKKTGFEKAYNPKTSALQMAINGDKKAFNRTFKRAEQGQMIRLI